MKIPRNPPCNRPSVRCVAWACRWCRRFQKRYRGGPEIFFGTQTSLGRSRSHSSWKWGKRSRTGASALFPWRDSNPPWPPSPARRASRFRERNAIARFRACGHRSCSCTLESESNLDSFQRSGVLSRFVSHSRVKKRKVLTFWDEKLCVAF